MHAREDAQTNSRVAFHAISAPGIKRSSARWRMAASSTRDGFHGRLSSLKAAWRRANGKWPDGAHVAQLVSG